MKNIQWETQNSDSSCTISPVYQAIQGFKDSPIPSGAGYGSRESRSVLANTLFFISVRFFLT